MKTKILSALYFIAGIIFMLLDDGQEGLPNIAVKALIIPLLILLFWINSRNMSDRTNGLMFSALLFSWAGDIALELTRQNELMFMLGLGCFLLTQVLYFVVFFLTPGSSASRWKYSLSILPVYLYGAGLLYYLYDDLGIMRIPVMIYAVVILTMLAGAISRIRKVSSASYLLVLCGAVLFVLSDSLIAVNKFSHPLHGASVLIMSTYISGQFMIVMGYLKQTSNKIVWI
jgi:uncharacterized membrane protein YhhN